MIEVQSTTVFWLIGTGLVLFSLGVFHVRRQQPVHRVHVLIIILLDTGWVIASILVVCVDPFYISGSGKFVVSVVSLIVLGFALHQSYSLSRADTA